MAVLRGECAAIIMRQKSHYKRFVSSFQAAGGGPSRGVSAGTPAS
jgi:hypothetical protein